MKGRESEKAKRREIEREIKRKKEKEKIKEKREHLMASKIKQTQKNF